jgi:hypothetical protein
MPIQFSPDRWDRIKRDYGAWWAGDLGRPLFNIGLGGIDPGRPEPDVPDYPFASFYDLDLPPSAIIDRWDYNLSHTKYVADGFPSAWPNFGAGVVSAFLGAIVENKADTTWYHPPKRLDIADIEFGYDPENKWLGRIGDIMRAAGERWDGVVQLAMTDLGGNLDILSAFRPGEELLLDLYDHPDEVKRLLWSASDLWWRYFNELDEILRPSNPGYTAWTAIYSDAPYYMLQCDFCYMISPEMFDEFVKPELAHMCRKLTNPFYHLDGPGQLPHLDSLLQIEELKGVQWVPGTGSPEIDKWPEVYRKISDAGKLMQIWHGKVDDGRWLVDVIADQIGTAEGIIVIGGDSIEREDEVSEMLDRYGAL